MPQLNYYLSKKFDETYTISFTGGPQEITGNGYVFKTGVINYISSINYFSDEPDGETNIVYFTKYFKYRNGETWSDLLPINQLSGLTLTPCEEFELELYYYRTINGKDTNPPTKLYVDNILIMGNYKLSKYESEAVLSSHGDSVILKPNDIYKIFSLTGFNVYATSGNYDIKYRFTQDGGKTYTQWEPLTQENISTVKLNPLRFAQVEYLITNTSDNGLMIYDIILEGDFQNVSANYLKTNRYGLKQDCLTAMLGGSVAGGAGTIPGSTTGIGGIQSMYPMPGSSTIDRDFYTSCISSYQTNLNIANDINTENDSSTATGNYWNPYQYQKITDFANMLGNQISSILGWAVDYHLTDPDGRGVDKFMHEYTLKNVVDVKKIKIVVPENKFPVEHVLINQFNLNLFDTFEVHIMKDEFKRAFGITKRPSEDDIIYICEANMLYYVKHAQAKRDIMNASMYYKLILEKYEHKTNIRNLVEVSQNQIDSLTNNTTIDELFGKDIQETEDQIANKEQTYPTSFEKIRHTISPKVTIIKNNIYIDNFIVSKQYYDLSHVSIKNKTAVDYTKIDQKLLKSDNRSFIFWFNFNNGYNSDARPNNTMFQNYKIKTNTEFNFLNNYTESGIGYKIYYKGGSLFFKLNNDTYKLTKDLMTNIWYAGVINLNQRLRTIDLYIYRRNSDISVTLIQENSFVKTSAIYNSEEYNDLISQGYKPIDNIENQICTDMELVASTNYSINPTEFEMEDTLKLLGSNIKLTNIRVLNDVIPETSIINILKQDILRDEQHLILADNATKQLITVHYFNPNFR
ncbi:MAG: hypothetical protein HPY57_13970 [Ignavibacteria bacterium]|nr:hypothetical protein [Ignavibacteria bacterium]